MIEAELYINSAGLRSKNKVPFFQDKTFLRKRFLLIRERVIFQ